jgi:hypothetical protein
MNTVGKILVILNFLFAVAVGAFLVVDFAARSNWKTEYDKLKQQVDVISGQRDQVQSEFASANTKFTERELENAKLRNDLADQAALSNARQQELNVQLAAALDKAKDSDLTLKKALSDVERLKVVESDLRTVIKDREQAILGLQADVKLFRTQALSNEQLAKSLADRNQELLTQVQDLSQKMNKLLAQGPGGGGGPEAIVLKTNEPNPPSTLVKGKVEKVDANDKLLIQISLGTDQGVNKNNTLEVFRTAPEPKYVGMVRIVDATYNRSVGRLVVPAGAATRPQAHEGDLVWSWLAK